MPAHKAPSSSGSSSIQRTAALPGVEPCLLPAPLPRARLGALGSEPAHRMVPGTAPRLHLPAGAASPPHSCRSEHVPLWRRVEGYSSGGQPCHFTDEGTRFQSHTAIAGACTMLSHIHRHYKGWRFCSGCVFQLFFSFLFFLSGWEMAKPSLGPPQ